jgi:hypothetical protein
MARTTAQNTPAAAIAAVTAPAMTQVQGFAVQIIGFIPIPKNDLRRQSEIPLLLLDINEGRKPLSALTPLLRSVEFRQQHVGKRVTVDEFKAWQELDNPPKVEEEQTEEQIEEEFDEVGEVEDEDQQEARFVA